MKKRIIIFFSLLILSAGPVFADEYTASGQGVNPANQKTMNGLLESGSEVEAYGQTKTTSKTGEDVLFERAGMILGIFLSFLGLIFFGLALFAGFRWMIARGNAAEADKAKNLLYDAVIGLAIVIGAYVFSQFIGNAIVN